MQVAQAQTSRDAEKVYEKASPAIVFVQTDRGTGSGIIIESNGLIVTNAHVIENAKSVKVQLHDGQWLAAEVVSSGSSRCLDLALLQVKGRSNLATVKLAGMNSVRRGQLAFAIGYPRGITPSSITQGIVSNLFSEEGMILTDVELNRGNSGGALLNERNELIGINTRRVDVDTQGMNLAIASEQVQAFLQAHKQGLTPLIGRALAPGSLALQRSLSEKLVVNGVEISGNLQKGDNFVCGTWSHADLFTFEGKAKQPISIGTTHQNIHPALTLYAPDGRKIAEYYQGADRQNGNIYGTLPKDGTYTLVVHATQAGQTGAYRVQVVSPLLIRTDELGVGDTCAENGSLCRRYQLKGQPGQQVSVRLSSSDFQPTLVILDGQGKVLAEKSASGQTTIDLKVPADGIYRVVVRPTQPHEQGQFVLTVLTTQMPTRQNIAAQ
jgi:serine protease Do